MISGVALELNLPVGWAYVIPHSKIAACTLNCRCNLGNNHLSFFWPNRRWAQFPVLVVFMVKHEHRNHAPSPFLISKQSCPCFVPQMCATNKAAGPVVALNRFVIPCQQERYVLIMLKQRFGDGIPMPQQQLQNLMATIPLQQVATERPAI
jgi:hypothetical protein